MGVGLHPTWALGSKSRNHLHTRTLCHVFSVSPFSNLCPLLGLKVFRMSNFALFRYFFSLFHFFSSCLEGEVRVWWGVGGRGWMATSSVDPPACDSNSSKRLVFFLCWSTIASSMSVGFWLLLIWAKGRGLEVVPRDSIGFSRLNTSKSSSSESTIWNTLTTSSSRVESKDITSSSTTARWLGSSTWWVPSGGGPVRNPSTTTSI